MNEPFLPALALSQSLCFNLCSVDPAVHSLQPLPAAQQCKEHSAKSSLHQRPVPAPFHAHMQKRTGFHHACRRELRGDHDTKCVSPSWKSKRAMGMAGGGRK